MEGQGQQKLQGRHAASRRASMSCFHPQHTRLLSANLRPLLSFADRTPSDAMARALIFMILPFLAAADTNSLRGTKTLMACSGEGTSGKHLYSPFVRPWLKQAQTHESPVLPAPWLSLFWAWSCRSQPGTFPPSRTGAPAAMAASC